MWKIIMLKIKTIRQIKWDLKLAVTKYPIIFFNRNKRLSALFFKKIIIIHCGDRFLKKRIFPFDVNQMVGSFTLTKKPFRKPITANLKWKI